MGGAGVEPPALGGGLSPWAWTGPGTSAVGRGPARAEHPPPPGSSRQAGPGPALPRVDRAWEPPAPGPGPRLEADRQPGPGPGPRRQADRAPGPQADQAPGPHPPGPPRATDQARPSSRSRPRRPRARQWSPPRNPRARAPSWPPPARRRACRRPHRGRGSPPPATTGGRPLGQASPGLDSEAEHDAERCGRPATRLPSGRLVGHRRDPLATRSAGQAGADESATPEVRRRTGDPAGRTGRSGHRTVRRGRAAQAGASAATIRSSSALCSSTSRAPSRRSASRLRSPASSSASLASSRRVCNRT